MHFYCLVSKEWEKTYSLTGTDYQQENAVNGSYFVVNSHYSFGTVVYKRNYYRTNSRRHLYPTATVADVLVGGCYLETHHAMK